MVQVSWLPVGMTCPASPPRLPLRPPQPEGCQRAELVFGEAVAAALLVAEKYAQAYGCAVGEFFGVLFSDDGSAFPGDVLLQGCYAALEGFCTGCCALFLPLSSCWGFLGPCTPSSSRRCCCCSGFRRAPSRTCLASQRPMSSPWYVTPGVISSSVPPAARSVVSPAQWRCQSTVHPSCPGFQSGATAASCSARRAAVLAEPAGPSEIGQPLPHRPIEGGGVAGRLACHGPWTQTPPLLDTLYRDPHGAEAVATASSSPLPRSPREPAARHGRG
jgi:hypothetical protein